MSKSTVPHRSRVTFKTSISLPERVFHSCHSVSAINCDVTNIGHFLKIITLLFPWFSHGKIWVAFPEESQLRRSPFPTLIHSPPSACSIFVWPNHRLWGLLFLRQMDTGSLTRTHIWQCAVHTHVGQTQTSLHKSWIRGVGWGTWEQKKILLTLPSEGIEPRTNQSSDLNSDTLTTELRPYFLTATPKNIPANTVDRSLQGDNQGLPVWCWICALRGKGLVHFSLLVRCKTNHWFIN